MMASGDVLKVLEKLPRKWYTTKEIAELVGYTKPVAYRQLCNENRYYNTVEVKYVRATRGRWKRISYWRLKE